MNRAHYTAIGSRPARHAENKSSSGASLSARFCLYCWIHAKKDHFLVVVGQAAAQIARARDVVRAYSSG
jgi:hypothetical protein